MIHFQVLRRRELKASWAQDIEADCVGRLMRPGMCGRNVWNVVLKLLHLLNVFSMTSHHLFISCLPLWRLLLLGPLRPHRPPQRRSPLSPSLPPVTSRERIWWCPRWHQRVLGQQGVDGRHFYNRGVERSNRKAIGGRRGGVKARWDAFGIEAEIFSVARRYSLRTSRHLNLLLDTIHTFRFLNRSLATVRRTKLMFFAG